MSKLAALYGKFHAAMLDNDVAPLLPEIRPNSRATAQQQLAIYIDGYRMRLIAAIRADYPLSAELLGKNFEILAGEFIQQNPPSHFNLDRYPHRFAAFVRGRTQDAFMADIATLEGAIAEVFLLPESTMLKASILAGTTPEQFSNFTVKARKASRLLVLYYPVSAYLNAMHINSAPRRPEPQKNYLYLVRHDNEVKRHSLTKAEYTLLVKLCKGQNIGEAMDAAMLEEPGLAEEISVHLQRWFARWAAEGFFQSGEL